VPAVHADWAAIRAADAFRIAAPRTPIGGRAGERLGSGTGSSLEFQDYRHYAPGDDLRHVDWAGYARSDVLNIRLYREEVAPRVDLVLDVSRSMQVTETKARAYAQLSGLLACACARTGADVRVITLPGQAPRPLTRPEDVEALLVCETPASVLEASHLPLRRRSLRLVISDFLFPHDGDALTSRLARDGAWLAVVQLTLREEAEPEIEGGRRLMDVEGHGQFDLVLDQRAVHEYRARFNRLRAGLSTGARRLGARFSYVAADASVREMGRTLAAAGVLEAI
jgi:uncharacterized protein (DUF58 family)